MDGSSTIFRRAFVDVCNGYSVVTINGKKLFIRHLSHREHLNFDDLLAQFEREALASGARKEKEILTDLKGKGLWGDKQENDILRQRDLISRFEEGLKTISLPSVLAIQEKAVAVEKKALEKLLTARHEMIGMTAESYAYKKLNDFYIISNLFSDNRFENYYYSESSFEDLGDSEIEDVMAAYSAAIEPCSDANIRKLVVQDFFQGYYLLCQDDLYSFFGKPIANLTYYQVKLGNNARYFKYILENCDVTKLDPEKRFDPDSIEKLHMVQKNSATVTQNGQSPVGTTKEDRDALGLQTTKMPNKNMNAEEFVKFIQGNKG